MNLIDTHAHLTYPELENQIDDVLARSKSSSITGWITIGTDTEHTQKALALAARFENMWAGIGIHPHYANEATDADVAFVEQSAQNPKVVAIGETGLDYHYDNVVPDNQKRLFRALLDIAVKYNKPVIIHTRQAFDDSMAILNEYKGKLKGVVIHCYGGDMEQTKLVLDRGYYISFTGTITFKKSDALREAAKIIPLDKLMIETDCPFISPEPVRRIQPNEPSLMIHTAKLLATLHNLDLDTFAQKVTSNSKRFFSIQGL
jgi:TatD DNase family protein